MNDRYLYRAKRKNWRELPKDKWWVEGYYAYMKPYHYIMPKENYDSWIEIDEKTLCACTGLKDKNGKLIWENDIVKGFNGIGDECSISKIVFTEEYSLSLGWCTEGIKSLLKYDKRVFSVGFKERDAKKSEVIGNIFDNPEMLEVGE